MSESPDGRRPRSDEYAPFYAHYLSQVPDGGIVGILREQIEETVALLRGVMPGREEYRYAPGKWSIREVLGHMLDTEWVFTHRALWFARGDAASLPGIEQDEWAARSNASGRPLTEMLDEWRMLRRAGTQLFASFDETILDRSGVASDCRFTVRAILYITAGHERHHREVLRARYLGSTRS